MTEAIDTLFEQAVEALRQDDRVRARELLTRLIKANQKDVNYWIWMSAAVDTAKERVYCLETALKLDPENEIAKRGLMLIGARPPERDVKPFSIHRARVWEDNLFLANEAPHQTGFRGFMANPATRLAATVITGAMLISVVVLIGINQQAAVFQPGALLPAGPTAASTATPTFVNISQPRGGTPNVPTPLAVVLGISYTPTPLYVNTPRAPAGADIYRAAQAAHARGDWDAYVEGMLQVQQMEPAAPDIQYDIGERYRLAGDCANALFYFNESLKINDAFAPSYLGLARARLCSDPGADVRSFYQMAQNADAAYGEVYLDRAQFLIGRRDYDDALLDLEQARRLMPNSALVQVGLAQVYLMEGDVPKARSAAERAYAIDQTLLPAYYYLGRAHIESGDYDKAIPPLNIYLTYEPRDGAAFASLGQALAETGDYQAAVDALNQALRVDRNQVSCYVYLGTSYLELENLAGAEVNFRRAIEFYPDSFDANIGMTEIHYRKGTFGTAYLQAESAYAKAETDGERALAVYWRALAHEGRGSWNDAIKDWNTLLNMPGGAVTAEMRAEAREHLRTIATPTRTPRPDEPTATASITPTPRPGSSATLPAVTATKEP